MNNDAAAVERVHLPRPAQKDAVFRERTVASGLVYLPQEDFSFECNPGISDKNPLFPCCTNRAENIIRVQPPQSYPGIFQKPEILMTKYHPAVIMHVLLNKVIISLRYSNVFRRIVVPMHRQTGYACIVFKCLVKNIKVVDNANYLNRSGLHPCWYLFVIFFRCLMTLKLVL